MHGEEGLAQALKATEALRPGAETALDAATLEAIAGDAPSCSLDAGAVTGVLLTDVMVAAGMLKSKGEVRLFLGGDWARGVLLAVVVLQTSGVAARDSAARPHTHAHTHTHRPQVKRLIKGGGVYLNNAKVTDVERQVAAGDLIDGKLLLLAAGKKNKMLVRVTRR